MDQIFSPEQVAALSAPLDRANVHTREQSGQTLSYIEGWVAIAEANRIFGFDGWQRQVVDLKCVSERERTIGRQQKPGWGVTYTATVRITVGPLVREGTGAGHGIDVDLGQAHESAIKEAETDAMKRALMTFGNPFGLALYDKQQRNVTGGQASGRAPSRAATPARTAAPAAAPARTPDPAKVLQSVEAAITRSDLTPFGIRTVCHLFSGGTTQALRQVPQEQLEKIPTWITRPDNIAAFNAGTNPRTGEVVLVPEPSDLEDPEDQSLLSLAGAAA
jgi:DNA recombination protein Rad52